MWSSQPVLKLSGLHKRKQHGMSLRLMWLLHRRCEASRLQARHSGCVQGSTGNTDSATQPTQEPLADPSALAASHEPKQYALTSCCGHRAGAQGSA